MRIQRPDRFNRWGMVQTGRKRAFPAPVVAAAHGRSLGPLVGSWGDQVSSFSLRSFFPAQQDDHCRSVSLYGSVSVCLCVCVSVRLCVYLSVCLSTSVDILLRDRPTANHARVRVCSASLEK